MEGWAQIRLQNYSILSFKKYYNYFVLHDFDKIRISGDISIQKNSGNSDIIFTNHLTIYNLNFQKLPPAPPLEIQSRISINFKTWKVVFHNAKVNFGELAVAETNGFLDFQANIVNLYLDIHAQNSTLEKLIDVIMGFTEFRMNNNTAVPDFYGKFQIDSRYVSFHNYSFQNVKGILEVENDTLKLQVLNANFYEGNVTGTGKILVKDKTIYDFSVICNGINSENLIQRYTPRKYVTGSLSGEFQLRSQGIYYNEFINELHVFGNFQVSNGRLLGYANFFKPILTLGKYLNWNGPKGESTEFQSLSGNFNLFKKNIELTNLSLKGVGVDAKGKGNIGLDNSINLKITVSLAGMAGKIISVPIVYQGVMPQNMAYIDPIWLGSVYLGLTLTGNPYGGVAGSALNEYVEKGIDSVKSFFQDIFKKK